MYGCAIPLTLLTLNGSTIPEQMVNIVFFSLGNPGPINRHSTGHYVIKHLVEAFQAPPMTKKGKYSITHIYDVYFVKSNTYMNESGALLRDFLAGERVRPCVVVIVYDDFELSMPKARIQQFQRNESHNGIKSVAQILNSLAVQGYKLGVGIGPKPLGNMMASWVLSKFTQQEMQMLEMSMQYVYKYVHKVIENEGEIADCGKLNAGITKEMSVG